MAIVILSYFSSAETNMERNMDGYIEERSLDDIR